MTKYVVETFDLIETACRCYSVDFMFGLHGMELTKVTEGGFSYKKQYSYNHINRLDMPFIDLVKEFVIEFEREEKLNNVYD